MILFLLCSYLISTVSSSPTIDCFIDSKKCIVDQNLVETHVSVHTMEECSVLCRDNVLCISFTYFGQKTDFIAQTCLLFSSCSQREPCKDCVSGTVQYECDCGIEFEGIVDENNFVDLVPNVENESSCKHVCARNEECAIYTYYNEQDTTRANMCLLLMKTGLQQPVSLCDHCKTGPATCETGQECQVAVLANYKNGETQNFFLEESTTLDFVAGEKDCFHNITVLAIGGGGKGLYHVRDFGGGGGGSGYVEMGNMKLVSDANYSVPLEVTVGGPGQSSLVAGGYINASMGNNCYYYDGGDGYSGGGAAKASGVSSGGDGGSNGGNGKDSGDYSGGKGSGLNLEHMIMKNFVLTPAEGGNSESSWGGGGGGVLVNGIGPDGHIRGFGGGGQCEKGNSGCVLIEF